MDKIADVNIDPEGTFKYIQVELKDSSDNKKIIIRGFRWADYHGE